MTEVDMEKQLKVLDDVVATPKKRVKSRRGRCAEVDREQSWCAV
ncbi:hypothetical protein O9993_14100 [Vibrio lentus]|nr:hypothetical protein [Vibrio lentus]